MSVGYVELTPRYLLNKDWVVQGELKTAIKNATLQAMLAKMEGVKTRESMIRASVRKLVELEPDMRKMELESTRKISEGWVKALGGMEEEKVEKNVEEVEKWLKSKRIEVAEAAETTIITSKGEYDYLKSELGMNIILPTGSIEKMKFKITLKGDGKISKEVVAVDGFPKDVIREKELIKGKIKVVINEAFEFVPLVGNVLSKAFGIELGPWEFNLGSLRKVNIDFSGGLTSTPEWFFKKDGIKNDLRVALTIRKPRNVVNIRGEVVAGWEYREPGFFKKSLKTECDKKTVIIFD